MSCAYGPTVVFPAPGLLSMAAPSAASGVAKENSAPSLSHKAASAGARSAFTDLSNGSHVPTSSCRDSAGLPLKRASEPGGVCRSRTIASGTSTRAAPLSERNASDPAQRRSSGGKQSWVDIDAQNADNPLACSEYAEAIFAHLHTAELLHRPSPDYLDAIQPDMTPNMRCILVDWLVEVAQEYRLTSDTLHLTVCLLDRFLSTEPIPREELQLAGIAAMWAAAKFEEIYAPTARSFCYITDNTYDAAQLVDMEARLLAALEFRLAMPTAKTFQRRYLQAAAADERLHYLSAFLLELSLMDECLLNLLPSQLAAASVYAAGAMLGRKPWDCTLTHYSRYRECDVLPVASRLAASHARLLGEAQFTAICDKYCSPKLLCVSATPPCQRLLAGAAADGSAAAAMAAQLQQHLMATATAPAGGAVCATAPVDCSGSGSGSGLDCSSSDMELL